MVSVEPGIRFVFLFVSGNESSCFRHNSRKDVILAKSRKRKIAIEKNLIEGIVQIGSYFSKLLERFVLTWLLLSHRYLFVRKWQVRRYKCDSVP